jgi:hypothetical protein
MRADEYKCKFLACVAASDLDLVLLNYIVLISQLLSLLADDHYEIRSSPEKSSKRRDFY